MKAQFLFPTFLTDAREYQQAEEFWLNTFAKGEPEEINELVISCSLTDSTLSTARGLIRQWITEGRVSPDADSGVNQPDLPYFAPADRPA
jgi:hypothetical protein